MNKEKKNLLILRTLSWLELVVIILWMIATFISTNDAIISKTIGWLIFILVQVLSIYIGYRIKLHKKKYMKSEKREQCYGE